MVKNAERWRICYVFVLEDRRSVIEHKILTESRKKRQDGKKWNDTDGEDFIFHDEQVLIAGMFSSAWITAFKFFTPAFTYNINHSKMQ